MVKKLFGTPASHVVVPGFKFLAPLPFLASCSYVPWEATDDGSGGWTSVTHVGDLN